MFREIRRADKQKTDSDTAKILESCTHGILSVIGDNGYPYGVPVSYVYTENKIIIHCALVGHKLDAVVKEPKVSFTVVAADKVIAEKFTTVYSSAICFGQARIVESDAEKNEALEAIVNKYCGDFCEEGLKYIKSKFNNCKVIVINIEHMTGKGLA